ncbi:PQQ-binding-like beta-propeller repeat protein [Haloarchaeobius sp. DFWS5]|uniref:PQQ-binding-like beta-propeller repeat protein n=1 Tax=Haloarchaeobius sp. DFWS5 TaxID=3446114 RepID=UPI003EBBD110
MSSSPEREWTPAPVGGGVAAGWSTYGADHGRTSGRPNASDLPDDATVEPFLQSGGYPDQQPIWTDDGIVLGVETPADSQTASGFHSFTRAAERQWVVPEMHGKAIPTQVGETVFLTTAGQTRAVDAMTGEQYWSAAYGIGRPQTGLTYADGNLFVCDDGVVALDATSGEQQWTTGGDHPGPFGTAIARKAVYAATTGDDPVVYRIDRESGNMDWITDLQTESYAVPVVTDQGLCVTEKSGTLRSMDMVTGGEQWDVATGETAHSPPAYGDGTVYFVPSQSERLRAIDATNGEVVWEFSFDGGSPQTPTVTGEFVYLPTSTDGGTVHKLDAETGEKVTNWSLPQAPSSSLVLFDGSGLVNTGIATGEGRVYVLRGA